MELLIAGFFAVIFAGISKGGFGGSLGVLSVPVFALVTDPITAAALMLPILCFMDLIGLIALVFTLYNWFGKYLSIATRPPPSEKSGYLWGATAGFTSFVAHAGGPPLSVYLLPQKLDRTTYQASTVIFFTAVNYIKLIPYLWLGLFTPTNLKTSLILMPVVLAGMLLGFFLHKRVSDKLFYRVCYAGLFALGIKLIYEGITAL